MGLDPARSGRAEDFRVGFGRIERFFSALPSMLEKEVRDRGRAVRLTLHDVDVTVAISVLSIGKKRSGHELTEPDRTGKGAAYGRDGKSFAVTVGEVGGEFLFVVGRTTRVVEGERHEGVDHSEASHVLAVYRFDSDHGRDDVAVDAEFLFEALERCAVSRYEVDAVGNSFFGKEIALVERKVALGRRLAVGVGFRRRILLRERRIACGGHLFLEPVQRNVFVLRDLRKVVEDVLAQNVVLHAGRALRLFGRFGGRGHLFLGGGRFGRGLLPSGRGGFGRAKNGPRQKRNRERKRHERGT